MIIYRPHRGSLEESLSEAIEFQTEEQMIQHIYMVYEAMSPTTDCVPLDIKDIVIDKKDPFDDLRIGWHDTMSVCIKRWNDIEYIVPQCIGMYATDYDDRILCDRGVEIDMPSLRSLETLLDKIASDILVLDVVNFEASDKGNVYILPYRTMYEIMHTDFISEHVEYASTPRSARESEMGIRFKNVNVENKVKPIIFRYTKLF